MIERAGSIVAIIEFRDLGTESFEVRETVHTTTQSRTELALGTGSDVRLIAFTMRKVDSKWQPVVSPIDCTLISDDKRITETEIVPPSDPMRVLGRHITLTYHY